jgi:FtsP/CotA-like multicopper oxidase with cupredoxin domain
MNRQNKIKAGFIAILSGILLLTTGYAMAEIQGVTGTTFNLVAKEGYISTGDADSVYMWGYAHMGPQALHNNGNMQFPGPTLIVNQGDTVTVTLDNELPDPDRYPSYSPVRPM